MPKLTINIPDAAYADLINISRRQGISREEALRKAFALLAVSDQIKAQGNSMAVTHRDENNEVKIIDHIDGI